jgi:hypothetical protein
MEQLRGSEDENEKDATSEHHPKKLSFRSALKSMDLKMIEM